MQNVVGFGLFSGDLGDELIARHADGARQPEFVTHAIVQMMRQFLRRAVAQFGAGDVEECFVDGESARSAA